MSVVGHRVRAIVEERAGWRCEYCHLPMRGQIAPFPIDHVAPRSGGGSSDPENLALACPRCNGSKWAHATAFDVETGQQVPLFNPRVDAWNDHFRWSREIAMKLEARTACGRATIERLGMNRPLVLAIRQLLAAADLFAVDANE